MSLPAHSDDLEAHQLPVDLASQYTPLGKRSRTNLHQWRVLHAVVSCGGYYHAAQHLHLTQPAISYAIIKLERQLGVTLLRLEGRKAYLTEAGKILMERSLRMLQVADDLEATADLLAAKKSSESSNLACLLKHKHANGCADDVGQTGEGKGQRVRFGAEPDYDEVRLAV